MSRRGASGQRARDAVDPEVVRYSERPELWAAIEDLSSEVWPEYNLHGDVLGPRWNELYEIFPEWQFMLYDPGEGQVLAEGHTIPVAWDGGDASLGPGIDASFEAGFRLRARGGSASALCALAAEIRPGHQGRGLSSAVLLAMAGLASGAGLRHLIAPVRPNLKERYPTIPIERYTAWTREDGTPFDPWIRVHTRLGGRWARLSPARCGSPAPSRTGSPGPRCGSRRPATTCSRPAWPRCTSTGTRTRAGTGSPTSGSSTGAGPRLRPRTPADGHRPGRQAEGLGQVRRAGHAAGVTLASRPICTPAPSSRAGQPWASATAASRSSAVISE